MAAHRTMSGAGLAIGLGLMVIGAVLAYDASSMQVAPAYARVGPQVFPYIISSLLVLCGLRVAWESWRGDSGMAPAGEAPRTDWMAVAIISAVLLAQYFVLVRLGFVISAACVFVAVAFAFGSRKIVRDVIVGIVLAIVTTVGFTRGLGLQLPPGLLKGLF